MTAFILTWKADEWPYIERMLADYNCNGIVDEIWRLFAHKKADKGDTAFLLKQGPAPRGIFGVGRLLAKSQLVDDPTSPGQRWRAKVRFYMLSDPRTEEGMIIPLQELKKILPSNRITARSSGQAALSAEEESALNDFIAQSSFASRISNESAVSLYQDELPTDDTFAEGALAQVFVNRFERSRNARKVCLDHWGFSCSVCDFDFEKRYGAAGAGFIHVHHLKPLKSIGQEYEVDPIKDLRPICPNCHAMIHRGQPDQYTIQELQELILDQKNKVKAS